MRRAVPERALQGEQQLAASIHGETLERDSRARDVAAEAFQAIPAVCRAGHGGVQKEALLVGREGLHRLRPCGRIRSPELITSERRGWRIREVEVAATEGNPDDSPRLVPWLETAPELPGSLTFCTGFVPGGAAQFLAGVVEHSR